MRRAARVSGWPYSTQRWKRLSRKKRNKDPFCEYRFPGCEIMVSQVDHKVPISKGGDPWAWENLASACQHCHSQKTYHVDTRGRDSVPVKGCDADGWPNDPKHHWRKAG